MGIKPSLDIVIVNWNAGGYLLACLESMTSVAREDFDLGRVMVVDNNSSDGSAEGLDVPGVPLTLERNAQNRGFAAACNQGAKGSSADYLLFLNPDTVLFSDSLATPLRFMERTENARVGICGIRLQDELGRMAKTCSPFPTPGILVARMFGLHRVFPRVFPPQFQSENELETNREVDQVIGAFFLIRRRLFEQLEGFDERFFVYFDDVDLSLRARRAGHSSFFLNEARACHAENKCTEKIKAVALFYYLRSRNQYAWKHFGIVGALGLLAGTIFVESTARVLRAIIHGSFQELRETVMAYSQLFSWFLSGHERTPLVSESRQCVGTENKGDW